MLGWPSRCYSVCICAAWLGFTQCCIVMAALLGLLLDADDQNAEEMAVDQTADEQPAEQHMLATSHLSRQGIALLRWEHTDAHIADMNQHMMQAQHWPRIDWSLFDETTTDGPTAWSSIKEAYCNPVK